MAMVTKPWDDGTIDVEEAHLERAKELIREHGITEVSRTAQILAYELGIIDPLHDYVSKLFVVAENETAPEREAEMRGWKRAIDFLRRSADMPDTHTGTKNLTQWAVLVAAADVLEHNLRHAALATKEEKVCNCRCMQGKDCGGCGHKGCGYRKPSFVCTCGTRTHCIHHCGGNHS